MLDGYEKQFGEIQNEASKQSIRTVELNVSAVRKITSSGIAKLLSTKKLLEDYGVDMKLTNVETELKNLLEKFRLSKILLK